MARDGAKEVLALAGVEMHFLAVRALNGIDLTISEGEIVGFIGPNGAGKTTTLAIAATLLRPTLGSVRLFGADGFADVRSARTRIGYMPELPGVYDDMQVVEYLEFFSAAHDIPPPVAARKIDSCLEEMDLTGAARYPVSTLSKGMKQKLFFGRTLLHDPRLLLLDEPFSGLDPGTCRTVQAAILEHARRGRAFLVASHDLTTLERIATRVVTLSKGAIVADGTADRQTAAGTRIYEIDAGEDSERAASLLRERFAGEVIRAEPTLLVALAETIDPRQVLSSLVHSGVGVAAFTRRRASLHDRYEQDVGDG